MTVRADPLAVAAVDLGSNSFHLIIGRFLAECLQRIGQRLRDVPAVRVRAVGEQEAGFLRALGINFGVREDLPARSVLAQGRSRAGGMDTR